jgi:integrase/recombinase XerD
MTYTFARVGAVVSMSVDDYYPEGKRWWLRLHEKGGKRHEMPAHHKLEAYLVPRRGRNPWPGPHSPLSLDNR